MMKGIEGSILALWGPGQGRILNFFQTLMLGFGALFLGFISGKWTPKKNGTVGIDILSKAACRYLHVRYGTAYGTLYVSCTVFGAATMFLTRGIFTC